MLILTIQITVACVLTGFYSLTLLPMGDAVGTYFEIKTCHVGSLWFIDFMIWAPGVNLSSLSKRKQKPYSHQALFGHV